eukprot:CAMPEP_0172483172 /NCGR_PEP_ID=MMETSP1066-20121228/10053_1 /TAXON_ID=671091 /ORGANISM="Coscinodiscus wailesii, Strain CCMP2513" /LENGTH=301 /DNA_ID=CAMNT_0013246885 /DNA_START=132 /DNA_END=1037 /DNA_ORIENTATION=-
MTASTDERVCTSDVVVDDNAPQTFTLEQKWQSSPDSWLLRFSLPPTVLDRRPHLGPDPNIPTCVSVFFDGTSAKTGEPKQLKKSYSPVSHPSAKGSFDLLVKAYPPRPGGGVGAYICDVAPGDAIVAKLKAERIVHGSPVISRRWKRVGLVAGGTGVAPLVQIMRLILDDAEDSTTVHLLSINRREEDILMREELDRLAAIHPDRFSVTYSLTGDETPADWKGERGRGSVEMAREALPPPADADGSTMIFVCGKDGFVETWGGLVTRGPPKTPGGKGPKVQGPLLGILREAGYDASEVYKY